jgi:putative hydrolase of the HAD superfamily
VNAGGEDPGSVIPAGRIKGILFDFYLTLLDIRTNEEKEHPWRVVADLLRYQGATISSADLRRSYHEEMRRQLAESSEQHADVDVAQAFGKILSDFGLKATLERRWTIAQLFRSQTVERFGLFPETREVVETLAQQCRLAIVSDSQPAYILPELRMSGLEPFFEVVVISAVHGYRKPDRRMFETALEGLKLSPHEVVHVGDTWERDVEGAFQAGITPVWLARRRDTAVPDDARRVHVIHDLRGLFDLTGTRD